jgi:hypothetical protein
VRGRAPVTVGGDERLDPFARAAPRRGVSITTYVLMREPAAVRIHVAATSPCHRYRNTGAVGPRGRHMALDRMLRIQAA